MPIYVRFLQNSSIKGLKVYFIGKKLLEENDEIWSLQDNGKAWDSAPPEIINRFLDILTALPKKNQKQVRSDFERILLMSDKGGQSKLGTCLSHCHWFRSQPTQVDRVTWAFIYEYSGFCQAESVHRTKKFILGQNRFRYQFSPGKDIHLNDSILMFFKYSLESAFPIHESILIEPINYSGSQGSSDTYLFMLYFENLPNLFHEIVNGERVSKLRRTMSEIAIIYTPRSGILEIQTFKEDYSDKIAKVFSNSFFWGYQELNGTPEFCNFDLMPFLEKQEFEWDAEDGIENIVLETLKLKDLSQNGAITLESVDLNRGNIYEYAEQQLGGRDPLQSDTFIPTLATINILFEPKSKRKNARILPITIATPNRCDLYKRTTSERELGEKYLKRWGVMTSSFS